jgi:hypothetical protein
MAFDFEPVVWCVLTLCRTYLLLAATSASTITNFSHATVRESASSYITLEQTYTTQYRKQTFHPGNLTGYTACDLDRSLGTT